MRIASEKGKGAYARATLVFLVGGTLGFLLGIAMDRPVPVPPEAAFVTASPSVIVTNSLDDAKAGETIAFLRGRLAELEAEVARTATVARAPSSTDDGGAAIQASPPVSRSERRRQAIERLKQENPAQYAEMQKRMETFRKQMEEAQANQRAFFESIDTSRMSAAQLADHKRLLAASKKLEDYRARFSPDSPSPLTEEERMDYFETRRAYGEWMAGERRYLLESIGTDYGEDGEAFADYVEAVFEFTSPRGRGHRGGGGSR